MNADVRLIIRKDNKTYQIFDYNGGDIVLSKTILHPHQSTSGHKHAYTEIYYFNDNAFIQIENNTEIVNVGEFRFIPSNVFHRVWNNSDNDLEFLCAWSKK